MLIHVRYGGGAALLLVKLLIEALSTLYSKTSSEHVEISVHVLAMQCEYVGCVEKTWE